MRLDSVITTGLAYSPGDPVRVHVVHRSGRVTISDDGQALQRAGISHPWRVVAERLARAIDVNVSRAGTVWLPVVAAGPGEEAIVERIARASQTFYQDLLDLE